MPTDNADDFYQAYDDLTADVRTVNYRQFSFAVKRWLANLDDDPLASATLIELEKTFDWPAWYATLQRSRGMVGSGVVSWPSETQSFLAARLGLFRDFSQSEMNALNWAHEYMPHQGNFIVQNGQIVQELFTPFARDMRRFLTKVRGRSAGVEPFANPLLDRIVKLEPESELYQQLMVKLSDLESALRAANDVGDTDEHERHIAEVKAGHDLLKQTSVRTSAIGSVLGGSLSDIGKKFKEVAIGHLAGAAWGLLATLVKGALGL